MRTNFFSVVLVSVTVFAVGCGGNSGVAEIKTYPPVTAEEQATIDANYESLKDEKR